MEPIVIALIFVALVESLLLIAQGEELSDKNDLIRYLNFRISELEHKGGKDERADGTEGGPHETEGICTDCEGQGTVHTGDC